MRPTGISIIVALALGCGGSKRTSDGPSARAGPEPVALDALWRQAPAGSVGAVVVAPGALADLHRGWLELANGSLGSTRRGAR